MKPGYKTTEFYGSLTTGLALLVSALSGGLSDANAAKYGSVVAVGYAVARGLAKVFPPKPGP
jgi:hypothetical protein